MTWKTIDNRGWGRMLGGMAEAARPETQSQLAKAATATTVLAIGNGRSYGDAGVNAGGRVILTRRLDRMLAFDPATGTLVAEPGVTVAQVMDTFLPRGWMLPVVPGTGAVTLGGAIANDVHGKNHDHAGSFGNHVEWFDLILASGETCRVVPGSDLFAATIGGVGLTGVIARLAVRLVPAASAAIAARIEPVATFDALVALMETRRAATFTVAWVDGRHPSGRGILESGEIAPADTPAPVSSRRLRIPVNAPAGLLHPLLMTAFNEVYFRRGRNAQRIMAASQFFFPLDALADWNRLYGRRGFFQFQCVIPEAGRLSGLLTAARAACPPNLVVLKTLGAPGQGMLSFPQPGWTLAMDFPNTEAARALAVRLEAMVLDAGGRVYLAKDALSSPASIARMYPRLDAYRAVLREVDPHGRWSSGLGRRLNLRGA